MDSALEKRLTRIRNLIDRLAKKTKKDKSVIAFVVSGSFSEASDHEPTIYSDVDL